VRIVELSTFHETCGIATYTEALVDALAKEGADVDVLAPALRPGVEPRGEQPQRLWSLDHAKAREALATFREVRRRDGDVVHAQVNLGLFSPRFLALLGASCRAAGVPLFATLHGRGGGSLGRRLALWRTHLALVPAELIVHNAEHAAELARGRVHVVPHGLRPALPRDMRDARRALGLNPDRPVIASIGFLHPDKGIEPVLRALGELARSGRFDGSYTVVGGAFPASESRAYIERLRDVAREVGLEERLRMSGQFLPDAQVELELAAADFIVLNYATGNSQGTSGAARTALASGQPVAVSTAAIFDDVRDAVHTLRGRLSEELEKLLSDEHFTRAIAERGARYVRDHGWARVAEQHYELFERALRRSRSR